MVTSLAGTERKYLVCQVRTSSGCVHFQVESTQIPGNRGYGWSGYTPVLDVGLMDWLSNLPHPHKSLAGTDMVYTSAQVSGDESGDVHFQIPGSEFNRSYGAAFTYKDTAFSEWVLSTIDSLEEDDDDDLELEDDFDEEDEYDTDLNKVTY